LTKEIGQTIVLGIIKAAVMIQIPKIHNFMEYEYVKSAVKHFKTNFICTEKKRDKNFYFQFMILYPNCCEFVKKITPIKYLMCGAN